MSDVYAPLLQIEDINTKCRIQLTKVLSNRHQIRMTPSKGEMTDGDCRGIAVFLAFDPWNTCWRLPPGSFRYFDLAERSGLITGHESAVLTRRLLRHAAEMSALYQGNFSFFFKEPRVKTILGHAHELDHLSESGLAVGGAWSDRLFETCPFPVLPAKHLEVLSFRPLAVGDDVEVYSETPWLAWIEALDLACLGMWMGFTPQQIVKIVDVIAEKATEELNATIHIGQNLLGQKVIIPFFSNGLQGIVYGHFHDVPKLEREAIIGTLTQFGQTLADAYSVLRNRQLAVALDDDLDDQALLREFINAVSPVSKVVLQRDGNRIGFRLAYEHIYWAGYHPMTAQDLEAEPSPSGFTVMSHGASIYIEPLADLPNFPADFTRMRLESCLSYVLRPAPIGRNGAALLRNDVQRLSAQLSAYAKESGASLTKLRQSYIVSKVEENWDSGTIRISNIELKRFLEDRLGREIKTGYQVTSFTPEIERIFEFKVTIAKTRNALSLSWKTTA